MIWYRQSKTKDGASGSCTRVQLPVCVSLHFLLPMPCSEFLKLGGHLLTTVCAQCRRYFCNYNCLGTTHVQFDYLRS